MYKWSNEWKRKGFYAILILFCGCCFIGISKKTKETEGEIQQKESVEESGVKAKYCDYFRRRAKRPLYRQTS